jgi:isocitrate dehydrogenase
MQAVLDILNHAHAPLDYDVVEIGERVYLGGVSTGISNEAWDMIRKNRVLLKAPVTTPQGGGYKSINVTLRKSLGLFANVRPCKAYSPFIYSNFPKTDLIVIRENEEDLYGGIEHRQTREMTQVLKLVSCPGSERIIRYAFEYAHAYCRQRVTCMTKDNIMKITDGMFHHVFDEIASLYPEIPSDHQIIDIGMARVADQPEDLDVVVTLNLYGDILSDVAAQVAGSVGLAGSANIGSHASMFEAIHGSAPDIAGKGIANPSGLLQAAVQMLVHLGYTQSAETIHNAWLCTLEDGIHTSDIFNTTYSRMRVGTQAFAEEVIGRLGQKPRHLKATHFESANFDLTPTLCPATEKTLVGVDVFVDWSEGQRDPQEIGQRMKSLDGNGLSLGMITNRGVKVYPEGFPETFCTDHWRCRFNADGERVTFQEVLDLQARIDAAGFEIIKTEHLYTFDGERGYSRGQGE